MPQPARRRRRLLRTLLLCLVLLTAMAAFLYWSNNSLQTDVYSFSSDRLPAAFDGFRIVQLTDLHGKVFGEDNRDLLQAVQAQEPDIIVVTGDLVDENCPLDREMPLMEGLCAIAPVYYVTGNHEWAAGYVPQLTHLLQEAGVTCLQNSFVPLQQGGSQIVLAGVEDPNGYRDMEQPARFLDRLRREVPGDPYVVMLCHRNNTLDLWASLEADLVLAGHGHGGVIRLPFVGGLLSVDRTLFPQDCEGLYTRGRTTLAVSRGLGGVRLWNRPHLPTLVLHSQENAE